MKRISNTCIILLGCTFIVSGFSKIINVDAFASEIAQYAEYYLSNEIIRWRTYAAICVCILEIIMGILAVFRRSKIIITITSIFFFAAMCFFLYLTGMNYFNPPIEGSIESCGCFGELIHFTAQTSFYKSLFLWVVSAINLLIRLRFNECKT